MKLFGYSPQFYPVLKRQQNPSAFNDTPVAVSVLQETSAYKPLVSAVHFGLLDTKLQNMAVQDAAANLFFYAGRSHILPAEKAANQFMVNELTGTSDFLYSLQNRTCWGAGNQLKVLEVGPGAFLYHLPVYDYLRQLLANKRGNENVALKITLCEPSPAFRRILKIILDPGYDGTEITGVKGERQYLLRMLDKYVEETKSNVAGKNHQQYIRKDFASILGDKNIKIEIRDNELEDLCHYGLANQDLVVSSYALGSTTRDSATAYRQLNQLRHVVGYYGGLVLLFSTGENNWPICRAMIRTLESDLFEKRDWPFVQGLIRKLNKEEGNGKSQNNNASIVYKTNNKGSKYANPAVNLLSSIWPDANSDNIKGNKALWLPKRGYDGAELVLDGYDYFRIRPGYVHDYNPFLQRLDSNLAGFDCRVVGRTLIPGSRDDQKAVMLAAVRKPRGG